LINTESGPSSPANPVNFSWKYSFAHPRQFFVVQCLPVNPDPHSSIPIVGVMLAHRDKLSLSSRMRAMPKGVLSRCCDDAPIKGRQNFAPPKLLENLHLKT
jgi:hypothetical protein